MFDRGVTGYTKLAGFITAILVIGGLVLSGSDFAKAGKVTDILKRVGGTITSSSSKQKSSTQTKSVKQSIFSSPLETTITSGPEQNSFVQNAKVEFFLDGWQILPFKKVSRFDVWLVGVDSGWKNSSNRVTYNLPPGKKTYTFMARAKDTSGNYDVTPVVRAFTVYTSQYFGKLSISSVSKSGSSGKPEYEKFTISAKNIEAPVNISGWKVTIKRSGFSFVIPSSQKVYDPRSPSNTDSVVLENNGSVEIFVGKRSPLGVNFHETSCGGYLSGVFESYDSFSGRGSCQLPDSSSYGGFSKECRSFINGIGSCKPVSLVYYQFINEPSCRDFILRNYNYQSCVERNRTVPGFFSGKWRVYLGRSDEILDDLSDTIYLHDAKGMLAAVYSY